MKANRFERLDSDVDKEVSPGCWVWRGSYLVRGNTRHPVVYENGKPFYADRLAFSREYGTLSRGTRIVRTCDSGECVNPAHYVVSTSVDAVFTAQQIKAIEIMWSANTPVWKIAHKLKINSMSGFYRKLKMSGYALSVEKKLVKIDAG
jgi:hypothetical protein